MNVETIEFSSETKPMTIGHGHIPGWVPGHGHGGSPGFGHGHWHEPDGCIDMPTVPEPSTWALVLIGISLLLLIKWRNGFRARNVKVTQNDIL